MSTTRPRERISDASLPFKARLAGVIYALVFLTGGFALVVRTKVGLIAGLVAGVLYIAVTLLFYSIFKQVNKPLSLLAAVISLTGIIVGPLGLKSISPLVFFGFYCLLIGYLVFKSNFLPRFLGALMVFAGLGWLTFLWPPLANSLSPYNFLPGIIGEGALTLWLLVKGVNERKEVAHA